MHASTYKIAKRHNKNRKHQINIHQGSEDEGIIRWLSESNRSSYTSIVCPQKESHTETQEAQSARETREERFSSREPCGKIKPEDSLTDALEKHSQHW